MVFRTVTRLTGHTDNVDELAQDVFLRLYRALPSFRGEALVSTYLYRITVNVAQDEWKRRQRIDRKNVSLSEEQGDRGGSTWTWEDRLEYSCPNALQSLEHREFQQRVETHLAQLSQVERTILVLYHQEERSYDQIAAALRIPIGTVRTHLHRGRKKLKDAIAKEKEATVCSPTTNKTALSTWPLPVPSKPVLSSTLRTTSQHAWCANFLPAAARLVLF